MRDFKIFLEEGSVKKITPNISLVKSLVSDAVKRLNFYEFLLTIGLMPAKSKILQTLRIPMGYFLDFFPERFKYGCILFNTYV